MTTKTTKILQVSKQYLNLIPPTPPYLPLTTLTTVRQRSTVIPMLRSLLFAVLIRTIKHRLWNRCCA